MEKINPFTLMFGALPQTLISREESKNEILEGFLLNPPLFRTYLICGVRGSGKTVLMTAVAEELKASEDWIVVDLNSTQNLIREFADRLEFECKNTPKFLDKGIDISAFGFGLGIGGKDSSEDDVSRIERMLGYVSKKNKKVLITIDEVSNNDSMRVFASQFQIFIRKNYPVFLIMTGLYENIYAIQNEESLTFLLRSPKVILEPLNLRQIANRYQKIFDIDVEKSKEFAIITKGYAFAFQAFGMLYMKYRDSLSLSEILDKLDDTLDEYVYRKIWSSLSNKEQLIIMAMPIEGSIKTGELGEAINMTLSSLSQYRERLIRKGVITSPKYGHLTLALPRFGKIIREYPIELI